MIKTAINIEPLYPGLEICEKIRKVSAAGFKAIEFWSWDDRDIKEIKKTLSGMWSEDQCFHRHEILLIM